MFLLRGAFVEAQSTILKARCWESGRARLSVVETNWRLFDQNECLSVQSRVEFRRPVRGDGSHVGMRAF